MKPMWWQYNPCYSLKASNGFHYWCKVKQVKPQLNVPIHFPLLGFPSHNVVGALFWCGWWNHWKHLSPLSRVIMSTPIYFQFLLWFDLLLSVTMMAKCPADCSTPNQKSQSSFFSLPENRRLQLFTISLNSRFVAGLIDEFGCYPTVPFNGDWWVGGLQS